MHSRARLSIYFRARLSMYFRARLSTCFMVEAGWWGVRRFVFEFRSQRRLENRFSSRKMGRFDRPKIVWDWPLKSTEKCADGKMSECFHLIIPYFIIKRSTGGAITKVSMRKLASSISLMVPAWETLFIQFKESWCAKHDIRLGHGLGARIAIVQFPLDSVLAAQPMAQPCNPTFGCYE